MVIIAAQAPPETIRRADDLWSWFCGRAREQVPEVAVGPGATSVEILPQIGPRGAVRDVHLSPHMLDRTRRRERASTPPS